MAADGDARQYLEGKGVFLYADLAAFDGERGLMVYNRTDQEKGKAAAWLPMTEWIVAVGRHPGLIPAKQWIAVRQSLDRNKSKAYRKPSRLWITTGICRLLTGRLPNQKPFGERIANEILMHFRSQRKSAQDVSLSDYIETGTDGAPLQLMDVVSEDSDLLEQVSAQETVMQLRKAVDSCLTEQERMVILLRYGLAGQPPKRQREVAQATGISRSYVSRIEKKALQKLKAELEK